MRPPPTPPEPYEDHEDFLSTKLVISDYDKKVILDIIKIKYAAIVGKNDDNFVLYGRFNDKISIFTYDIINHNTSIIVEDIENSPIGYVPYFDLSFSSEGIIFMKRYEEKIFEELAMYNLSGSIILLT
jgi:hypothetical protein